MGRRPEKSVSSRWAIIAIAAAMLLLTYFLPTPEGLEKSGEMGIVLLFAGIILWASEVVPLAIATFAIMVFMYVFGVSTASEIWSGWASTSIFFILASFGISTAMLKTKIPTKIVFGLVKLTKGRSKRVVFAFMAATWFISLFISDFPSTALMASIAADSILKLEKAEPGKSNLGRCLLIGIPVAAVVGGAAMPTGSAMNIMAQGLLASTTGITIAFAHWVAICMPMSLMLLAASYVSLTRLYKPENISRNTFDSLSRQANELGRLGKRDGLFLGILSVALVLWITGNWTGVDATVVALGCLCALFLPGIDQISWGEYRAGVAWDIVLLVGGVSTLAEGIQNHGGGTWLFASTVGKVAVTANALVAGAAVFLPIVKLVIPTGPAIIALFLLPLAQAGGSLGVTPAAFAVMCGVNASNTFLLGLDSNHMLAYHYGYWKFGDFFKAGIFPTVLLMAMHSTILVPMLNALGY